MHTQEFMEYPVAIKTSFSSPEAKKGPTCSKCYTHKKQRASSWAVSRSKSHPQRSLLSTEGSVFCIHLIPLEREKGEKASDTLQISAFQRTQEVPWFQADLLGSAWSGHHHLKTPQKKKKSSNLLIHPSPGSPKFPAVIFLLAFHLLVCTETSLILNREYHKPRDTVTARSVTSRD